MAQAPAGSRTAYVRPAPAAGNCRGGGRPVVSKEKSTASEKSKPDTNVQPQAESQGSAQVTPPTNPGQVTPANSLTAGSQGANETLNKNMWETLMNTSWDQTISEEQSAEFRKGTEVDASVWVHGPAQFQFLALADRRLTNSANSMRLENTPTEYVERLHARLIPNTSYMVVRPAPNGDLSATEVKRYDASNGAWANFINLLGPTQFRVEFGWKERYAVAYIPKGSPLGYGVVIDLRAPLERRRTRRTKDEEGEGEEE